MEKNEGKNNYRIRSIDGCYLCEHSKSVFSSLKCLKTDRCVQSFGFCSLFERGVNANFKDAQGLIQHFQEVTFFSADIAMKLAEFLEVEITASGVKVSTLKKS